MERMEVKMIGGKRTSGEMEKAETMSQYPEVEAILAEMKAGNFGFSARPELWNEKTWNIIKMRLQFPAFTNTHFAKRLNVSREWVLCVLNRANLNTRAQSEYCDLVCAGCGIIFRKKKANIELLRAKGQTRFYHNKKCFHKDLRRLVKRKWDYEAVYKLRKERNWRAARISKELGIPIATVENILKKGNLAYKYRKDDCDAVFKLKKEKKWGAVRIGMELGISPSTVLEILRNKREKSIGNRIWEHTCRLIGKMGHFVR